MAIIEIKNLSKVFSDKSGEVDALSNVSLSVEKGEIFGIIGLSGAGKSTLVRCINALEKPTAGEILLNGKNVLEMSEREKRVARKNTAMIFQGFNLLEQRTVLKNVTFPLELNGVRGERAKQRAVELLKTVGLEEKCNAYPSQLSGGQKQRVAIARALASDPEVLLCDEATSALDPATTDSILDLLQDLNKKLGLTVVIITHEMRIVEKICNKVAVLDGGNLVECGEVKQVFFSPKSKTAQKLIFPTQRNQDFNVGKKLRLVFDGESYDKPLIASMILECQLMVNILFANTKTLEGKTYGQMIIEIPCGDISEQKITGYLRQRKINFKEISENE